MRERRLHEDNSQKPRRVQKWMIRLRRNWQSMDTRQKMMEVRTIRALNEAAVVQAGTYGISKAETT